jgi:hypothetical protein
MNEKRVPWQSPRLHSMSSLYPGEWDRCPESCNDGNMSRSRQRQGNGLDAMTCFLESLCLELPLTESPLFLLFRCYVLHIPGKPHTSSRFRHETRRLHSISEKMMAIRAGWFWPAIVQLKLWTEGRVSLPRRPPNRLSLSEDEQSSAISYQPQPERGSLWNKSEGGKIACPWKYHPISIHDVFTRLFLAKIGVSSPWFSAQMFYFNRYVPTQFRAFRLQITCQNYVQNPSL